MTKQSIHVRLGVDSRHADQQVRGALVLPHGTGKTKKSIGFAKGDKAKEARKQPDDDYVGAEDMIEKFKRKLV